jgi:hypothetical protein
VAPLDITSELPEANEPLVPSCSVPPWILIAPVKVFAAPMVVVPLVRLRIQAS